MDSEYAEFTMGLHLGAMNNRRYTISCSANITRVFGVGIGILGLAAVVIQHSVFSCFRALVYRVPGQADIGA